MIQLLFGILFLIHLHNIITSVKHSPKVAQIPFFKVTGHIYFIQANCFWRFTLFLKPQKNISVRYNKNVPEHLSFDHVLKFHFGFERCLCHLMADDESIETCPAHLLRQRICIHHLSANIFHLQLLHLNFSKVRINNSLQNDLYNRIQT